MTRRQKVMHAAVILVVIVVALFLSVTAASKTTDTIYLPEVSTGAKYATPTIALHHTLAPRVTPTMTPTQGRTGDG